MASVPEQVQPQQEQQKYVFPRLDNNNPAGCIVDPASYTLWIGVNLKAVQLVEALCLIDSFKMQLIQFWNKAQQVRVIQPASALQSMKNFVSSKLK